MLKNDKSIPKSSAKDLWICEYSNEHKNTNEHKFMTKFRKKHIYNNRRNTKRV